MTEPKSSAANPPVIDRLSALPPPKTPHEARGRLVELLRRDLIGPDPELDKDLANEILVGMYDESGEDPAANAAAGKDARPSQWYLTGFLRPADSYEQAPLVGGPASELSESDGEDEMQDVRDEGLAEGSDTLFGAPDAGNDEASESATRRSFLPSSLGLSVIVPMDAKSVEVMVDWGDYRPVPPIPENVLVLQPFTEPTPEEKAAEYAQREWHRVPRHELLTVAIENLDHGSKKEIIVPSSGPVSGASGGSLMLHVLGRATKLPALDGKQKAVRFLSIFLVNRRAKVQPRHADTVNAYQVKLTVKCSAGFVPMEDRSNYASDEFDLRLGDLHYASECAYAVGHNVSGDWETPSEGIPVTRVFTNALPCQTVPMVAPTRKPDVELDMIKLAELSDRSDGGALNAALAPLGHQYEEWAIGQAKLAAELPHAERRKTAAVLLQNIEAARARIESGVVRLRSDSELRAAFRIMNEAIAMAAARRFAIEAGKDPDTPPERPIEWRTFQLAFILLNLDGLSDRTHKDREIVDLLFFPTGGGKTEAYLGLAALAIAQRRSANPGLMGAGLSVVMRYTLRLLTLDQLARATGLICALELIRLRDGDKGGPLGDWPIEIGLWVGSAATPNRLGDKQKKEGTATRIVDLHRRKGGPSPVPLKACPWCGTAFQPESFSFHPHAQAPQRLDIICDNVDCDFSGDQRLPVVTVDEEIYQRLPAFMIATVDKFANLPWVGESGAFFGHVDRFDGSGFYGAAKPAGGMSLPSDLPPIDLIIQDELHLISGPLGTVAGLYETAFDLLASRIVNGKRVGPKIVASTATVRRAGDQIRALFGRGTTHIFPPPGISRHDSFFAETDQQHDRMYVGLASTGRGPKLVFLRALQTLLAGGKALSRAGAEDPADAYLTALCYFNALRELGGARRIVDDEVRTRLEVYGTGRTRKVPAGQPFADRRLNETVELTSRVSTDQVAAARDRLGRARINDDSVDVALATNMISVGLDIGRLGLMLVQGQPKTAAEYIQATSRVGRQAKKPGLVVVLLNPHKPRDRMHYEQFRAFHQSFYRAVEPTSVTPFSPRALDRALAGTIVAAARHLQPEMTPKRAAKRLIGNQIAREEILDAFRRKLILCELDPAPTLERVEELLNTWEIIAEDFDENDFGYERSSAPTERLLQLPLKPLPIDLDRRRRLFEAGQSMRDTEPVALIKLLNPDGSVFGKSKQELGS